MGADGAEDSRTGQSFPPIDVYKLGNLYFVRDGHHRVSVGRALGAQLDRGLRDRDRHGGLHRRASAAGATSTGKNWGLRFLKRVPLTGERRAEINCTDPTDYHRLAEMVEAWACRLMHHEGALLRQADDGAAAGTTRSTCPCSS